MSDDRQTRDMSEDQFAHRAVEAIADAILASGSEHHAVAACPSCGAMIEVVHEPERQANHMLPVCPEWVEYMENWEESTP